MENGVIRVGVIGAGNVGAALVQLLLDESRHVALRDAATADLELVGVAVRDASRPREGVPPELVTDSVDDLLSRDLDVVVEVAGGVEPAHQYVATALKGGASVVTANKALVAAHGPELARLADENQVDLFYEAAVGGAIPILRALRTSLAGERIERVMGIVNSTTNFILSEMADGGRDFADVLREAQARGFAEADPTADVEGFDAAAKVQILSMLAFGTRLPVEEVEREGITAVRAVDVEYAHRHGFVIKLVGVAERLGELGISRRVGPTLVPLSHQLASVNGASNAVFVEGVKSGPLTWVGEGAGGFPTATAVLGDLLDASRNRVSGRHDIPFTGDTTLVAVPAGQLTSVFYLSVDVRDRPGVLATVAGVFGRHGVSIRTMEQTGFGDDARLSFLTHHALSERVGATVDELRSLDDVASVGACLRVIDEVA